MDLQLKGRRVLVTGSSAGLGAEMVRLLAAEGADVIVHGRDEDRTRAVADEVRAAGGTAETVVGDLTESDAVGRIAAQVLSNGGVDILVNNAGSYRHLSWWDAAPEEWMSTYATNVVSGVRMIQALVPLMRQRGWGRVITIGGGLGIQPMNSHPQYNSTLAARHNLSVSLARELAGSGVTSNVVSPGAILVPAVKDFLVGLAPSRGWGEDWDEIEQRSVAELVPNDIHRFGRPSEIAGAVAYLCSPYADYISGAIVSVDGGTVKSVH
jgi:NAD(P)-dependent dehydrogenase (short-subunit alcohol dehydrogenase family)